MRLSGTASWASSIAWAWRSWCGAKRRRTSARAASRRNIARAAAGCQGRPRVGPLMTQNSGPTGMGATDGQPGLELFEAPVVHADLAAAAAFATAHENRAAATVEIELVEIERFLNAQTGAPKDDDQ